MKTRLLSSGILAAAAAVLAATVYAHAMQDANGRGAAQPAQGGGRGRGAQVNDSRTSKEELEKWMTELSNWGRWGKDDQLGAANLITPAKRKQGAALVKNGTTVSLAHNPLTERAEDNSNPFEHTMLRGFFMDRYSVDYHGYDHSDIDALC